MAQREQWATRIGVIMAVAGSAVGLGNFLRFPGQAAQNGGGAFMIPYLIALLVLGIPLGWAEWTMGRHGGRRGFNSAPGIFSVIWPHPFAKYAGSLALLVPLIIYMYYVVIEAWCLGYAWYYLRGDLMLGKDAKLYGDFFDSFVGSKADGFLYEGGHGQVIYFIGITFLLNLALIYRGVSKGIETFCKYAMPAMAVCAICVLIRVLTLGTPDPGKPDQSVVNGLAFMWKSDPQKLWDPGTWLAAAGQIFFSLSVGFGIIINYASYLKKKDDVALSGLTASSMNEFFEVCLGGLITIPAAFVFLGAAAASYGTFGMGFNALPQVFAAMPAGRIFGFLWFFMLFLAAITSSISMLQPVIAFLEEGLGLRRHASVSLLGLVAALGTGFVIYFSKDLLALDTFDFWVGTMAIFVLAMFQSVVYAWVFGIRKGHAELHDGAHIRVPWFVQIMLKYVTPLYLAAIFIGVCINNLPSSEQQVLEIQGDIRFAANSPVDDALRQQLSAKEIELPKDATIATAEAPAQWRIADVKGDSLYTIAQGQEGLAVFKHKAGYIETVTKNPAAKLSVFFMLTVLAFLGLLAHIAGKRWHAEGRLPAPPEADEPNVPVGHDSPAGASTAKGFLVAAVVAAALIGGLWSHWIMMAFSVGGVLCLSGFCVYRVLTLPTTEEESLRGPLEIDTRDTVNAD